MDKYREMFTFASIFKVRKEVDAIFDVAIMAKGVAPECYKKLDVLCDITQERIARHEKLLREDREDLRDLTNTETRECITKDIDANKGLIDFMRETLAIAHETRDAIKAI